VQELLELSRLESGRVPLARQPRDVGAVLTQAVERLRAQAEKQGVDLALEVAPDLPSLVGDGERLERAVVSLIDNAVKFTPSGGSVSVSASFRDDAVMVEVSDTGVGIASEDLPHVFERFYKADRARGGTGLGLAVVKHTVEAHGGSVGVESTPGKGSTFRFSIPVATTSSKT
jgi:two-component system phosphate regulon sensor histidine kinase PhoR